MRPHAHANMCAAFMYSHKVGVSVYLSSFDTPLLLLLGYKPFSVPGAPLAMSDWFGLSFLCLTLLYSVFMLQVANNTKEKADWEAKQPWVE